MTEKRLGNALMVSNYSSDTAYAWWLMEHFWRTLSGQFQLHGSQCFVAYPKLTTVPTSITSAGIEPVELTFPWRTAEQRREVLSFIRDRGITAVYLTDQPWVNPQYVLLRRYGVRRIVVHDHTPGDRPPARGLKGMLKAALNSLPWVSADYMFCVSDVMRRRNLLTTRVPSHRCLVVQNGIEPVRCVLDRAELRNRLGIRSESIVVVTTGRAHPYKRFDLVIETAAHIRDLTPDLDVVFLLVGDGPVMKNLKANVANHGLERRVQLLGFRRDVRDILCAADIAMHAALGEGFSLSIIEYMSAGLPVLVPDIPSVKQAVEHGVNGMVYPSTDSATAAAYILALAADGAVRTAMGRAAKIVADSEYSLDRCTREFLHVSRMAFDIDRLAPSLAVIQRPGRAVGGDV